MPPPYLWAVSPVSAQAVTVSVPVLKMPPPSVAFPFLSVRPDSETVPAEMLRMRLVPPASRARALAPGPVIETLLPMASSVPPSAIVPVTLGPNVMVSEASLSAWASVMASRSEPAPLPAAFWTTKAAAEQDPAAPSRTGRASAPAHPARRRSPAWRLRKAIVIKKSP